MSATSPTQRSLKHLRDSGCVAEVVERWNPHSRTRKDLFGFVDILALSPDGNTIGVQATSLSNVSKRVAKIAESSLLRSVRECGWRVVVHGWGKGANGRYRLREVDVS